MEVVNQSLWALANISGDYAEYRDYLINPIIQLLDLVLHRVRNYCEIDL